MKESCINFLMEQFGDKDVVEEIYKEYVKSIGEKLAEADAAFASANWTELDHIAHAIKGNAMAAGDNEMANVAIELRLTTRLQDKAKATTLINSLKDLAKEI